MDVIYGILTPNSDGDGYARCLFVDCIVSELYEAVPYDEVPERFARIADGSDVTWRFVRKIEQTDETEDCQGEHGESEGSESERNGRDD